MEYRGRSTIVAGVVFILLGVWFLAIQFMPGWRDYLTLSWPLIVIGVGVLLLMFGLLLGVPSMAIPACIVGGIGGLLFWQNATDHWESWAYAWTLIPGFVGVGMVLSNLLGERTGPSMREGARLMLVSLVLFAIFGSFLGGPGLGPYWPLLLIVLGLGLIGWSMFKSR